MSRAGRLKQLVASNVPSKGTDLGCGLGLQAKGPNAVETPTAKNRTLEPRLTWSLLRGLSLRRPVSGPNLFCGSCPVGVGDEATRHRMTVRNDDSRGYRIYVLNCFPPDDSESGHQDPEDYDVRVSEILLALRLHPRDLYAQTVDHADGPCEVTEDRRRRAASCGRAGYRLDIQGLTHWAAYGLGRAPVLCLQHAGELTGTKAVLWPPKLGQ